MAYDDNQADYSFLSAQGGSPKRTPSATREAEYAARLRECQDPNELARLSKEFLADSGAIGVDRSGEVTVLPSRGLLRRSVSKNGQTVIVTAESVADLDRQTQAFLFGGR